MTASDDFEHFVIRVEHSREIDCLSDALESLCDDFASDEAIRDDIDSCSAVGRATILDDLFDEVRELEIDEVLVEIGGR